MPKEVQREAAVAAQTRVSAAGRTVGSRRFRGQIGLLVGVDVLRACWAVGTAGHRVCDLQATHTALRTQAHRPVAVIPWPGYGAGSEVV